MRSIVINSTRYADDGFMVDMYVEDCGLTTVSVKTSKRSRVRMCHIQPLTLLNVTLEGRPSQPIRRIGECMVDASSSLADNPIKMLTALFLAEVLHKVLRHTSADPALFDFVYSSISKFATLRRGESNFHIFFLIKLTHYLGIYPNTEAWTEGAHFDLDSGEFVCNAPSHGYCLTQSDTLNFANMLRTTYDNMHCWILTRDERNEVLEHIIDYYRIHAIEIGSVKSLEILRQL